MDSFHRMVLILVPCIILGAAVAMNPSNAQVLWATDGVAVCDTASSEENPCCTGDGFGGTLIAWESQAAGTSYNVVAQRLSADGTRVWASDGVKVCPAVWDQYGPSIAQDGTGGAIVVWQDVRSPIGESDIYAQKLAPNGTLIWSSEGMPVCTAPGNQYKPTVISDGAGGAFVAWLDTRNDLMGGTTDIYLQRLGANGYTLWEADLPIAITPMEDDLDLVAAPDGSGGVILAWQDGRSISTTGKDIYAQRVTPNGTLCWGTSGLPVCTAPQNQRFPELVVDSTGKTFIVWDDKRNNLDYDVYAQGISPYGELLWSINGVVVCAASGNQVLPTVTSDGNAGIYVAWTDARKGSSPSNYDIYAQRITVEGVAVWAESGVPVCTAAGWQGRVKSAPDGLGNVLFAWLDNRVDPTNVTYNYDVYVQSVGLDGTPRWSTDGISACSASGRQDLQKVAQAALGKIFVTWEDTRSESQTGKDIYSQMISTAGAPAVQVPTIAAGKALRNGTRIQLCDKVVTAVFGNSFYIQEADRSSGIRVMAPGAIENYLVTVEGNLNTLNGERVLANASLTLTVLTEPPEPLFINAKYIGGSNFGEYTPGVAGGIGLNNVGLLVTTVGPVIWSGAGCIYIGCRSEQGVQSEQLGLKVDTSSLTITPSGYVMVTGISSTEEISPGYVIPVLRPRRDSDIHEW